MRRLITGEGGVNVENFNGDSLGDFYENQDVFWDGLLQYLHNENTKDIFKDTGYGIKESMFPTVGADSIIEYINKNADLIETFLDSCLNGQQQHWNPSFQRILNIYKEFYIDRGVIDSTNISVEDIIKANAGNSFKNDAPWVIPYTNIDGKNYDQVRSNDKIERILSDDDFLQFTQRNFKKYIRLLMPEYERTVQIEDLDRNFWVIGQVLTGILSFLFSKDSPLNQLIDGMLDELAQLWENLLYLWIGFAVISQELKYKDIRKIVVPMDTNSLYPYVKFDDFIRDTAETTKNLQVLWDERLSRLAKMFNESTLIIIPEIRCLNYVDNYYAESYYPGVIVYNRRINKGNGGMMGNQADDVTIKERNNKLQIYPFVGNEEYKFKGISVNLSTDTICGKEFKNICGVYENSPHYYFIDYYRSQSGRQNVMYVGAIRNRFTIGTPEFNESGNITSLGITLNCTDVVRELCNMANTQLAELNFSLDYETMKLTTTTFNTSKATIDKENILINRGWYRGEVPSYFNLIQQKFTISLTKKWTDINSTAKTDKPTKAIVNVKGMDEYGFVAEEQNVEFSFVYDKTKTEQTTTKNITLIAYSDADEELKYTIKENPLDDKRWKTTYSKEKIQFSDTNKSITVTNRWTGIEYNGSAEGVRVKFHNKKYDSEDAIIKYGSLDAFLAALSSDDEKQRWNDYIEEIATNGKTVFGVQHKPLAKNTAKFYYSHYQYSASVSGVTASYLEISPYITLAIKDNDGKVSLYSFIYKISDSSQDSIHKNKSTGAIDIPYPYMSSVYDDINSKVARSTKLLFNFPKNWGGIGTKANIAFAQGHLQNYVTAGNLVYGTMKLTFDGDMPYLNNFLIYGEDRAAAGVGVEKEGDVKNLATIYPYYYKCSIKTPCSNNKFGEITATVAYRQTKQNFAGLTRSGTSYNYTWQNATKQTGYLFGEIEVSDGVQTMKQPSLDSGFAHGQMQNYKEKDFMNKPPKAMKE